MKKQQQDTRYEKLYHSLLAFTQQVHEKNKKRMKVCAVLLILLPFVIDGIRILTDSDKIVFLLIWVICMFLLCAYMIGLEYVNNSVKKKLEELDAGGEKP